MSHRRQNKSHKVPNVKLRPAYPAAVRPAHTDSLDSGFDSPNDPTQSFVDVCPRPFKGVVLCATGISDKTTLFKQAIELGAQPLNDLTDKVTHLLALEPGSAKYKCALDNRIPIMHPDWITDSYTVWLRGDDVNLEESVETHRLPIFTGVVLCISGLDDVAQRTEINRRVTAAGGSYVKNIERPVRVTHLLCAVGRDAPSEKMAYAAKFNARREADIRVVWEQWFWDCLRLGGRCDEALYDVSKPCPDRVHTPDPPDRPTEPAPASNALDGALDDDEEPAAARRVVAAVTKDMWSQMLRTRGFEVHDGKLTRSPSTSHAPPPVAPHPLDSPTRAKARESDEEDAAPEEKKKKKKKSVLAAFSRTASFAPQSKDASTPKPPFARAPSSVFAAPPVPDILAQGGTSLPVASSSKDATESRTEIFNGKTFRARGEARCAAVRRAVEDAGGRLLTEDSDEDGDFVLVRLVSGSKIFRDELDALERAKYRTECWLERCMFEERICPPEDHVSFVPIPVPTPVDGTERISLSFSGLDESEACWTRRLARALGMNIAPSFSRRTTHLLCPSREGRKFDKALEWKIPVVDMQWLEGVARSGIIPSEQNESQPREGKGKAVEASPDPMADITNGEAEGDIPGHHEPPTRASSPLGSNDYADFGEPVLLTDSPALPPPSPPPILAPPSSTSPAAPPSPPPPPSRSPSEALSLAELRTDMLHTTIRSSASPSPLKLPGEAVSPVRIPEEAEAALKARLSSLLGKRQAEEADVLPVVRPRQKRARPLKSKASMDGGSVSRVNSYASVNLEEAPIFTGDEDISMLVDAEQEGARAQEQRVTYFDPAQNDERLRLMRLLENQKKQEWEVALEGGDVVEESLVVEESGKAAGSKKGKRTATRRSARVSKG